MLSFFILSGGLAFGTQLATVEPEVEPFWRKKEKIRQRVYEEREVIVSVKTRKTRLGGMKEELYLQGVGVAEVPVGVVFAQARRFEDFPKMSSFVKSAKYDAATGTLQMVTSAFSYDAHLKMRIEFDEALAARKLMRFVMSDGVFRGMTGVLVVEDVKGRNSEIALTAQMGFNQLPIPKFFVEFGLEVALRLMATRMRTYVEEHYRSGGVSK